eukprot:scaffold104210_cov75-Phaeocystis_antarctica.AAC.3
MRRVSLVCGLPGNAGHQERYWGRSYPGHGPEMRRRHCVSSMHPPRHPEATSTASAAASRAVLARSRVGVITSTVTFDGA